MVKRWQVEAETNHAELLAQYECVRFTVENHYIRLLEPRDNVEWV